MYIKTMSHKTGRSKSHSYARHGIDTLKKLPLARDLELRNLTSYEGDYQAAFKEQLKAAKEGSNYKLRPGLHDQRIREAGIETPAEIKERIQLQKEASAKLRNERLATNKLLESIRSMTQKEKKGGHKKRGHSRRTRRANQKKRT